MEKQIQPQQAIIINNLVKTIGRLHLQIAVLQAQVEELCSLADKREKAHDEKKGDENV